MKTRTTGGTVRGKKTRQRKNTGSNGQTRYAGKNKNMPSFGMAAKALTRASGTGKKTSPHQLTRQHRQYTGANKTASRFGVAFAALASTEKQQAAPPVRVVRAPSNGNAPQRPRLSYASLGGGDSAAGGRAGAAYQEEFTQWQPLIEAISNDLSLSPEQRAATVVNLRESQQAAAKGAQQRVVEEEKQNAKAFRRYRQQLAAQNEPR